MDKRNLEIVVISDIHLGTYGCHAEELNNYLNSIKTKKLILNGDIFEGYVFERKNFDKHQFEFIRIILKFLKKGTEVYYLTGNHDDFLRDFDDLNFQNFHKSDKLILEIKGEKYWIFHGDIFDMSVQGKLGKFLTFIGGKSYDFIIYINRKLNQILKKIGKKPFSLSKKIKDNVKTAVKFINDFEKTSCEHAINQKFDYVINGHIHEPKIINYVNESGSVIYMNSGDFVENLSSLEYDGDSWKIFKFYGEEKN
jgi:UDP-2,3-diacylglucosamine pyrophosphatase LpxH